MLQYCTDYLSNMMPEPLALLLSGFLLFVVVMAVALAAVKIKNLIFGRFIRDTSIHWKYIKSLLSFAIFFMGILVLSAAYGYTRDMNRVLFGSAGLLVAIFGFAAQPVISDIVAGFVLGWSHPFDLGDKVVLEKSGISGSIRDITIRHVVIHQFDGLYVVVPNSVMNQEIITNNTYKKALTASEVEFCISYDSDIWKAMKIIHGVVETSRYTVPYTEENPEGKNAAVYITGFGDSSVKLRTVIWAHNSDDAFMARSDILFRVKKAFEENGIEIPYPFMNVVQREYVEREIAEKESPEEKRDIKDKKMATILDKADAFSKANGLSRKDSGQIRLLTEESVLLLRKATGKNSCDFWPRILKHRVELSFFVSMQDIRNMNRIRDLNSEKQYGILRRIRDMMSTRDRKDNEWSMSGEPVVNEDMLERSILENLADDIRISVKNQKLELTIVKELSV